MTTKITEHNISDGAIEGKLGYTPADAADAYTHPTAHSISEVTGLQDELDGKVDDSQVLTNVPANAVFTDTETLTSLALAANTLTYTDEDGVAHNLDLSLYLDDTNLARLTSGTLDNNTGIATFTRDDASTFTIDMSAFFDDSNTWRGIHDTPVNGSTTISISSNWAFDNVKTPVPSGAVFTDTVYTHPTTHSIAEVSGLQTALGGKVDDSQVLTNVPAGAVFTDTTYSVGDSGLTQKNFTTTLKTKLDGIATSANNYTHPTTHSISEVSGLQTALNNKVDDSQVLTDVPSGAVFTDTVYSHPTGDGNQHVPATGTTNNGKILTAGSTAGSASWQDAPVALPDQTGHNGQFLTTDGSNADWVDVDALPSQTGNSGKVLTTDGSTASWSDADPSEVSLHSFEYTATAGQTLFSGVDNDGNTLSYVAGNERVYLNGVQLSTSDYTTTSSTSLTLLVGASLSDEVIIIAFESFTLADHYTKAEVDAKMGAAKYNVYEYISTAGQTLFSGADVNGNTLSYTAGYTEISYGGFDLPFADYTATNGTSVTLDEGAEVGKIVRIVAFKVWAIADHYTKSESDGNYALTAHIHTVSNVTGLQTALDGKVDDSQVLTNVPTGALFTDTTYTHPATHPASMLTGALPAIDGSQLINLPVGGGGYPPKDMVALASPYTVSVSDLNKYISAGVGTAGGDFTIPDASVCSVGDFLVLAAEGVVTTSNESMYTYGTGFENFYETYVMNACPEILGPMLMVVCNTPHGVRWVVMSGIATY